MYRAGPGESPKAAWQSRPGEEHLPKQQEGLMITVPKLELLRGRDVLNSMSEGGRWGEGTGIILHTVTLKTASKTVK